MAGESERYVTTASRSVLLRLRSVLALAMIAIALTSLSVLLLLRSELYAHAPRAAAVDAIGRQRMLGQRLEADVLARMAFEGSDDATAVELAETLKSLEEAHAALRPHAVALAGSAVSAEIDERFEDAGKDLAVLSDIAMRAKDRGIRPAERDQVRRALRDATHAWVAKMDAINLQLPQERGWSDALFPELPLVLAAVIVLGLGLAWVFLCQPALQLALDATASLEQAQSMACLGSWLYEPHSQRLEWSSQVYAIHGRDPRLGPPNGAESLDYYTDADGERLGAAVKASLSTGKGYTLELRLRNPVNGVRVVRAEGRTIMNEDGSVYRLYGTVIDVTAAVEREAALQLAHRYAESANRSKSEFLANMSHEIRTPMTAILGYVDLLADTSVTPGEHRQYVATIKRSANHLLQIINDILDVSKIEAGQMTMEEIDCAPAAIVRDVVALFRPHAEDKGLAFGLRFDGPLPTTIQSDPTRLKQILANLVGNAVKFTEAGSVNVTVALETTGDEPMIRFEVKDSGVGMSAAEQEKLFRPFSQADSSTTRRFGGSGLGLNIANRLAMMLGGGITVASVPRLGSIFTARVATGSLEGVTMDEPASDVVERTSSIPAVAPIRVLEGVNVLVAEDGRDNQRLISLHLRRAGANVELAENGHLAVERLLRAPHLPNVDIVLMDMQMPVLDGYAATTKLRVAGYVGPIIGLTAHAMQGDRQKVLAAGCDDYVTKPIDTAVLFGAIAKNRASKRVSDAPKRGSIVPKRSLLPTPSMLPNARISLVPSSIGTRVSLAPYSAQEIYSDFDDEPEMADLIEMFVGELPQRIAKIEAAHLANDGTTLANLAHQLKGAGGGYGFPKISAAAARLEKSVRDHADEVAVSESVTALVKVCRSSRTRRRPSPSMAVAG